jgi:poly-gamma-glutamate synthesis protein (capsule biosynthesis protein)
VVKIFLCGDVMIGRGIDQILPYPCNSKIYEPFVKDARDYVRFAEEINGKIDYPVSFDYIWGDALKELEKEKADLRIINLETTITTSENFESKGINYRMNPKNIDVLKVFKVNVACLANNHILDFKEEGLLETIEVLNKNGILTIGAGRNIKEAQKSLLININKFQKARVIIFNYADVSSGVPIWWKAEKNKAGVNLLDEDYIDFTQTRQTVNEFAPNNISAKSAFHSAKSAFKIFSIHWGPNWGYEVTKEQRNFAHRLIDEANVNLIFGHSSHHFKGIETYKNKIIIYGAGDFINDYEGIGGYEDFRPDLALGYIVEISNNKNELKINRLILLPFKIKKFRLNYCNKEEIDWIFNILKRESKVDGEFIKEENRIILKLYNL